MIVIIIEIRYTVNKTLSKRLSICLVAHTTHPQGMVARVTLQIYDKVLNNEYRTEKIIFKGTSLVDRYREKRELNSLLFTHH